VKSILLREFIYFGLGFGLAFSAWSGVFGHPLLLWAVVVGAFAGLYGGLRVASRYANILSNLRPMWAELDSKSQSEMEEIVKPPSIALFSALSGFAWSVAVIGFIVWGIRLLF
jgi:hypothetical protein